MRYPRYYHLRAFKNNADAFMAALLNLQGKLNVLNAQAIEEFDETVNTIGLLRTQIKLVKNMANQDFVDIVDRGRWPSSSMPLKKTLRYCIDLDNILSKALSDFGYKIYQLHRCVNEFENICLSHDMYSTDTSLYDFVQELQKRYDILSKMYYKGASRHFENAMAKIKNGDGEGARSALFTWTQFIDYLFADAIRAEQAVASVRVGSLTSKKYRPRN